jgi:hypothetical protein
VLNAKGGESIRPKQKDHTIILFSENVLNYFFSFFKKKMAKGKAFRKREESLNLRNSLKMPFLFLRPYANNFEKILSKVCKNHYMWCKCGPKLQSCQYHSYSLRTAFISVAYEHLTNCKLVTISYFIFALVCVGINH